MRARAIAALCGAILVAGCGGRRTVADAGGALDLAEPIGPDLAMSPPDLTTPLMRPDNCVAGCFGCEPNETCFVSDATQGTCLRTCKTSADCLTDWTCATLITNFWTHGPSGYQTTAGVCFSKDLMQPALCPGLDPGTTCQVDAVCDVKGNLLTPISIPGDCGFVAVPCPHGCAAAPDGGVGAHCL